jgi:hypothetical protein
MAAPSQNLNITLAAFPALTSPLTVAQCKTLVADVQQIQYCDNRQVLAISVLANIYILAHAGGTNYKANLPQMVTDATTFIGSISRTMFSGISNDMLDQFEAITDWNTAFGLDATITANLNTLLSNISFLQSTPESTLRGYLVYLRYACSIKGV